MGTGYQKLLADFFHQRSHKTMVLANHGGENPCEAEAAEGSFRNFHMRLRRKPFATHLGSPSHPGCNRHHQDYLDF